MTGLVQMHTMQSGIGLLGKAGRSCRFSLAVVALLVAASRLAAPAHAEQMGFVAPSAWSAACEASVTADFAERDQLEPSHIPRSDWDEPARFDRWGPTAVTYPSPAVPDECDPVRWQEERILATIDKVVDLELNYCFHHIPLWDPPAAEKKPGWCNPKGDGWQGVDCSNFTSWIYNYALGEGRFTSAIGPQADGPAAPGERIAGLDRGNISGSESLLRPGDLLFIKGSRGKRITHVAVWTGLRVGTDVPKEEIAAGWRKRARPGDYVIADSTGIGPRYRPFRGWYKTQFSHARRVIGEAPWSHRCFRELKRELASAEGDEPLNDATGVLSPALGAAAAAPEGCDPDRWRQELTGAQTQ